MDYEALPTREVNWNKAENLSGRTYGKLTVIRPVVWKTTATRGVFWLCLCACGNYCVVLGQNLKKELTISCKCERSVRQRINITRLRDDVVFVKKQKIAAALSLEVRRADPVFFERTRSGASRNMRRLNTDPKFIAAQEERIRALRVSRGFSPDQPISRLSTQIRHALDPFRAWIFRRDGYKCLRCGSPKNLQMHHLIKVEDSFDTVADPYEVGTFCRRCHKNYLHDGNYRGPVNTEQTEKYREVILRREQNDPMNADLVRTTNEQVARILEEAGVYRSSDPGNSVTG